MGSNRARKLGEDRRPALNDLDLAAAAATEPVDVFAGMIRGFVDRVRGDHGRSAAEAQREASAWRSWIDDETGMGHVHGEFDPERLEAIRNAVDAHAGRLANQGGVQRTANLAATAAYGSVRETADGQPLTPEAIARLACNAVVQRIVLDENGVPVNVGRRYRTATSAQWLGGFIGRPGNVMSEP